MKGYLMHFLVGVNAHILHKSHIHSRTSYSTLRRELFIKLYYCHVK